MRYQERGKNALLLMSPETGLQLIPLICRAGESGIDDTLLRLQRPAAFRRYPNGELK